MLTSEHATGTGRSITIANRLRVRLLAQRRTGRRSCGALAVGHLSQGRRDLARVGGAILVSAARGRRRSLVEERT